MKTLALLLTLILAPFAFAAASPDPNPTNAPAARWAIGLTPFLDKSAKDDTYRRVVGLILEGLPLQSSLAIYDAYHLTNITRLEIPALRAFASGKTRANQFRSQIQSLREFLAAEHARPTSPRLNFDMAIRLPQFMDFLAENAGSSQPLTALLIGSPLYLDAKEPAFSMADGYFPSDGHLLASRDLSPFGLQGRASNLSNFTVHLGYMGDPWVSALHQEKIARFWSLYLHRQGARLATFVGDPATLFAAARSNSSSRPVPPGLDPADTKLEMLRITRDLAASDWITRDLLSHPHPAPPSKTVGPMKIGVRWKGEIDLDLYASSSPDSQALFFEHTRTPEGYYFKDHRNSPDREYEFIEFESPVDLWRVQAAVNFYKGSHPSGPRGEVRVEFDGRIYSAEFTLAATQGNKGRSGPSQSASWARLDLPAILGLRSQTAHRN